MLIAQTGSGHRSAACALQQALRTLSAEGNQEASFLHTDIIDVFATSSYSPVRKLGALYAAAICYTPRLYGLLYRVTDQPWSFAVLERLLFLLLRRDLTRLITSMRPSLVVSLHPLLNHVLLRVRDGARPHVPVVTVMTDLVKPHRGWTAPAVDTCIVPTEEARSHSLRQGVAPERIRLFGLPIDQAFGRANVASALVRQRYGLRPELPIVLLVGGGAGAGGLAKLARALWQADLPAQFLVVTGCNLRLKYRLERLCRCLPEPQQQKCRILGFVEQMPDLMQSADLVVTKAGPSTISEAVASRLPLVLGGYVPGQEQANISYVCKQGLGLWAKTPKELVAIVRACLQPGNGLLSQIRANMACMQTSPAATSIAACLLEHLEARNGQWDLLPLSARR